MGDITEDRVREIIKEELANFVPQKKKRGPNKWQVFLSDCAKRQPDEFSYPDKVKACSMEYKAAKKNGNGQLPQNPSNQQSNQSNQSNQYRGQPQPQPQPPIIEDSNGTTGEQ